MTRSPNVSEALEIAARRSRRTVPLDSRYARIATAPGRIAPNPLTAHLAYEAAMRAVEVALDRQRALAIAMTGPEVLIDVDLGDVSIGDFHRLDEVVEIGRRARQVALPRLRAALLAPACITPYAGVHFALELDPVCRMAISPGRARAQSKRDGITYCFCSVNCRDSFERHGDRYGATRPACGAEWTRENDRRRTQ